jgi:hypothetical protein
MLGILNTLLYIFNKYLRISIFLPHTDMAKTEVKLKLNPTLVVSYKVPNKTQVHTKS